ncbi:MAG: hypothetical protein QM703_22700 [Gemmatales bacterium]
MDYSIPWTLDNDGTIKEIGIRLNPHMQRMVLSGVEGTIHRKAIWEARERVAVKKKELSEAATKSDTLLSSQVQRQVLPCGSCGKKKVAVQLKKEESK